MRVGVGEVIPAADQESRDNLNAWALIFRCAACHSYANNLFEMQRPVCQNAVRDQHQSIAPPQIVRSVAVSFSEYTRA
jgi:hypothetical protein